MRRTGEATTVLTIRVPVSLGRRLAKAARARRRTRSAMARDLLEGGLRRQSVEDPVEEARRQSRLASAHPAERDALAFIESAADLPDWR